MAFLGEGLAYSSFREERERADGLPLHPVIHLLTIVEPPQKLRTPS